MSVTKFKTCKYTAVQARRYLTRYRKLNEAKKGTCKGGGTYDMLN